ncbi:MAG: DUF4214 domain-containing protein [Hyphomicrobiaceae bacterium]
MVDTLTDAQLNSLTELYIAYFARAPENDGLNFHTQKILDQLNASPAKTFAEALSERANQFFFDAQAEPQFTGFSVSQTAEEFVTLIYGNILGRPTGGGVGGAEPTAAEKKFWTDQIEAGTITRGAVVQRFLSDQDILAASGTAEEKALATAAQALFDNRTAVGREFAKAENSAGLKGEAAFNAGKAALASVTTDPASVQTAISEFTSTNGTTFTLTTNIDAVAGTTANDTIVGSLSGTNDTFNAGDTIAGAGGTDTLKIVDADGGTLDFGIATITDVENLEITDAATDVTEYKVEDVGGLMNLTINGVDDDQTVSGMKSTVGVTVKSQSGDQLTLSYSDAGDAGDQSATINLNGISDANNDADIVAAGIEGVTINTTGAASDLFNLTFDAAKTIAVAADEALRVDGTLTLDNTDTTAMTVSGDSAVRVDAVANDGALKTVTVSGSASYRQDDALGAAVTSADASGTTGTLEVTSGAATTAITGGSGDDNVTINGLAYSGSAKLDGGAGTDILAINDDTATVFTTAAKANISNFETLEVSGANKTFDFAALTGLTGLIINTATAATINNLSTTVAASGITVAGVQTTSLAVNVKDATDVGTTDTLKITLDNETADTAVTVADLRADGVETLNIVSEGAGTNTNTVDIGTETNDVVGINVSGSSKINVTDEGDIAGQQIVDASAATGNVSVIFDADTEGTAITGGAGDDVLEANSGADVIKGGAGKDTITFENSTTNGDTLSGDAGNDIFKMAADTAATITTHTITDFDSGASNSAVDTLQFSLAALEGLTTVTDLVDTSANSSAATDGTVATLTADAAAVANADLVVLNQNYANEAAVVTGLQAAGNSTITFGAALADNDAFLVAYTDGTDGYIAVATHGGGGASSDGVDSVENVVKLTGVTDFSNFDSSDFSYIA